MLKKIKRSIEAMPRSAYIFLINVLRLCCVMLAASLLLFLSWENTAADAEKLLLAQVFLESPAGLLLLGLVGMTVFIDLG